VSVRQSAWIIGTCWKGQGSNTKGKLGLQSHFYSIKEVFLTLVCFIAEKKQLFCFCSVALALLALAAVMNSCAFGLEQGSFLALWQQTRMRFSGFCV